MSKKKKRRTYSWSEKAAILRRHLADKVAVSVLCEEYKIQPSVFYSWQRQLFDNLETALEATGGSRKRGGPSVVLQRKVASLEAKLVRKDSVIAEISEEYVTLKKELGEL
jgi:transposase